MNEPSYAQRIRLEEIEGFTFGSAEDPEGITGCTVILTGKAGARAGIDIRGGAPASRESALLNPLAANDAVHAVVLSGGSAFGLDAAGGVMRYLEEQGIGFATREGVVPIVCASCLYDLEIGSAKARPDADMGYRACRQQGAFRSGSHGAGMGATVGKAYGTKYMMKSGIGASAARAGDLQIGAVAAVNALGDVFDPDSGRFLAGLIDPETGIRGFSEEALYRFAADPFAKAGTNTTIGVILTNGDFSKAELTKIAGMAQDGYARCIRPVHTQYDGDAIYALAHPQVSADVSAAGMLAARVMALAVRNAVCSAKSADGAPCAEDLL